MSFASGTPVEAWIGYPPAWTPSIYDGAIPQPTASRGSKKRLDQQRLRDRGAHFVRRTPSLPREIAPDGGVRAVGASASVPTAPAAPPAGASSQQAAAVSAAAGTATAGGAVAGKHEREGDEPSPPWASAQLAPAPAVVAAGSAASGPSAAAQPTSDSVLSSKKAGKRRASNADADANVPRKEKRLVQPKLFARAAPAAAPPSGPSVPAAAPPSRPSPPMAAPPSSEAPPSGGGVTGGATGGGAAAGPSDATTGAEQGAGAPSFDDAFVGAFDEMPNPADATELPDVAAPAANACLAAIDEKLLPAWEKAALEARWPSESARGFVRSFAQAFEPVAEGECADGAVAALHARDAAVERLRIGIDSKRPKIVSHDTRSLSRASGGLGKQTTWLHGDSMTEPNELSQRQGHSAGYYTARGGVSPQLHCMMKGDEMRGVPACAFDGCTAALPGQGHGVEPVTALYRPTTQLSAPIVRALALDGRVQILLLQGRKPNQAAWWDTPVAQLAARHVDLTASTLAHAPAIVGCALPSPSTFGLKNAKVIGFEFAQLGREPAYLVKLPELSESGATMSPCFARCPRRALRNAHEIAFVELLASALLTRAQGPPRALREHGVVQLTERHWRLGDEDDGAMEWVEGWEERRGRPVGSGPVGSGSGPSHGVPGLVEMSLLCPDGHLFWHERAKFSNGADSLDTATTIQVGVTPGGRFRAGAGKKALHDCAKCKLGNSAYGGSKVTVRFQLDGTCRCRWRDGSWTNGRWHERTETEEERGGPCELCEELREDEA